MWIDSRSVLPEVMSRLSGETDDQRRIHREIQEISYSLKGVVSIKVNCRSKVRRSSTARYLGSPLAALFSSFPGQPLLVRGS